MGFQFMPFYTGDYLRDTMHLSCAEHGIYCKLLFYCWDQRGPAPLDERKLTGITNARSSDEIEALRRVLLEFFVRMDDGWYNKRSQEEVTKAASLSASRSDAGRRGGAARMRRFRAEKRQSKALEYKELKQLTSKSQAGDISTTTTTPTPKPTPTPKLDLELSLGGKPSLPQEAPPANFSGPSTTGNGVVVMPLLENKTWPVPPDFLRELEAAYPDVIGLQTLLEIRVWFISNPTERRLEKDIMKFINAWFERTQNA